MYWTVFFLAYYMPVTFLTSQKVASRSWKSKSWIHHYCHKLNFLLTGVWHQTKHCCWLLGTNFWSALCYGGVKSFFWFSQGLLMWISAAFTDRQEQELFSCELNLVLNQWPVINLSTELIDFKVLDIGRVWLFQWSWYKKTF